MATMAKVPDGDDVTEIGLFNAMTRVLIVSLRWEAFF